MVVKIDTTIQKADIFTKGAGGDPSGAAKVVDGLEVVIVQSRGFVGVALCVWVLIMCPVCAIFEIWRSAFARKSKEVERSLKNTWRESLACGTWSGRRYFLEQTTQRFVGTLFESTPRSSSIYLIHSHPVCALYKRERVGTNTGMKVSTHGVPLRVRLRKTGRRKTSQ